ncbi:MAG: amidohydrolase [Novosphingobium sp.]
MDILDSQVHLGPGGAAEMVKAMDALGIASVLVDEWWMGTPGHPYYPVGEGGKAIRTTSPTTELACWQYPGRFAFLVRADRRDPDLKHVLRFWRDNPNVKALRISPGMTRAEIAAFAAGEEDPIFECAAELGLPIFVQISGNIELVKRYADKFPSVKIVICHTGMPPGPVLATIFGQMEGLPDSAEHWAKVGAEPRDQAWAKVLRTADSPNVALKWAHAGAMFDAGGYPQLAARPYLKQALGAFGAERIMWASDVSANQTGESWAELIFAIRENPELSESDKQWLLAGTAREWLNWK